MTKDLSGTRPAGGFVALGDDKNAQVAAGRMALYPMER